MQIELELNLNDAESLLRHCSDCQPGSGDPREDSRLADALEALTFAIEEAMRRAFSSDRSMEMIDQKLLEAAVGLFQDKALAVGWLSRPLRALGGKRPLDVSVEEALALIGRLEHGIVA